MLAHLMLTVAMVLPNARIGLAEIFVPMQDFETCETYRTDLVGQRTRDNVVVAGDCRPGPAPVPTNDAPPQKQPETPT